MRSFLSKEDDKYLVLGGIGTYIGVLSRTIRQISPKTKVYWLTESPTNSDFNEIDDFGVKRIYLSKFIDTKKCKFYKSLSKDQQAVTDKVYFNRKITEETEKILKKNENKNIVIESGEWEGLGADLFSLNDQKNVVKIVRLHTPLATCIKQNNLELSAASNYQLLVEDQIVRSADFISACTQHVKRMLIRDVLGEKDPLVQNIQVIPNPIDVSSFYPQIDYRDIALKAVNKILKNEFLTRNTCNVFIVGSVEKRKGVDIVINSVVEAVKNNPNVRFCFIGHCGNDEDKSLNANTKLSAKKLLGSIPKRYHRYVAFTDYVPHSKLPLLIQAGDIFPIMSIGDNFPGTVAEISLSGKPIVAIERGGVKEMLIDRKGNMLAVGLGENIDKASKLLSKAIVRLSLDKELRNQIGSQLRNHMLETYDPIKVTSQILESYRQVLTKK